MAVQANQQKYSSEYEYVMLLKSIFDQNLFPDKFDEWTMNKQCNWINKNLRKFYPTVAESLLEFIPASFHQGDYNRSTTDLPEWFDINKYRKGQKFIQDYMFLVIFTMILAALHIYSFEDILNGFIMGGHAHLPHLAFHRYLSAISRIMNWFNGEPWVKGTTAYRDMQIARKSHLSMRNKMCQISNDKIDAICTFENPWCPDLEIVRKNFSPKCPFEPIAHPYKLFAKSPYRPKSLSTANLMVFQCCFTSLVILHPKEFGVHNVTDDELEAFCHMWRCYGYFLGIEDEYNFCRGNLEEIKQRTRDFYQYWVMPNLKDAWPEWEHMSRCIVEPLNYAPLLYIPFKTVILLGTEVFDVNVTNLYKSLSYSEWISYKVWRFILHYAAKLSYIRSFLNYLAYKLFDQLKQYNPQKLQEKSNEKVSAFTVTY